MQDGVSVILLTWNGLPLLRECLPRLTTALAGLSLPHELIVVDNGSVDGTIDYLETHYPSVARVEFTRNLGFARANNKAIDKARYNRLLFINNDIYFEYSFVEPLYEALKEEAVFAAAPKMLRWDRTTIDDGLRYGKYYSGLFSVELEEDSAQFDLPHWVTFFCGGCFMCKRDLFCAWGGFDPLYTPYAWEDLDLSYRAWKYGFSVAYVPHAVAYHKREATTRSAFSNFFFIALMWRNKFIFMWKNLTSLRMLINHLVWLPLKLVKFLCNGRWRYVCGFLWALPTVPVIIIRRFYEWKKIVRTDEDVLKISYQRR